jgi:hypothetical protein
VGWEARGDELQMKGWRWWGGDAAAARDREMRFDAGWDTWGRRRGVHTRNCWMWVMTWIPERAGNGTKNQVLYDLHDKTLRLCHEILHIFSLESRHDL